MNIETDHTIDQTTTPLRPAVIHLTVGDTVHDLTAAQAKDITKSLTYECDAVQRHNATVRFAHTANPLTRSEQIERDRQWQRKVVAEQEAADAAERRRKSEEAGERRAAIYAARQAEAKASWEARAARIRAEQQGANK